MKNISVIGAGLAGSEAVYQIAKRGLDVTLFEMRPTVKSPAHKTDLFAELVCSNSLRASSIENAVGLLKEEMRRFDSLIMQAADSNKVPAGGALAVDRLAFSQFITDKIKSFTNVEFVNEEVTDINQLTDDILIVASGPLTSENLSVNLKSIVGDNSLYFYDAAAPIVTYDSIDFDFAFRASRYDKGDDSAYINCPLNRDEYLAFRNELINAQKTHTHDFEKEIFFEGCLPIEVIASRGEDTLRFGPMKPVGLIDPRTNELPYAVIQLRQDNLQASLFNIVGFQTHLTFPEQRRVFSMIPALHDAKFVRLGVMHRNTFINSPRLLNPTLQLKSNPNIFFAGQMTGVEGYIESAASGLIAGINSVLIANNEPAKIFPIDSCLGSLTNYISSIESATNFQPMNINFGLLPPFNQRVKRNEKKSKLAQRALDSVDEFISNLNC